MTRVEIVAEAVNTAVLDILRNLPSIRLEAVVSALDQVRAHWLDRAGQKIAAGNEIALQMEPVQVALADVERVWVGGQYAFKVPKDSRAAEALDRNGWYEIRRHYFSRYFVMPDGSEPPSDLTPVIEFAVPTREEIIRVARMLHARRVTMVTDVSGVHVDYCPSSVTHHTNRAGRRYTRRETAYCCFIKNTWNVTVLWAKGDEKPPRWYYNGLSNYKVPQLPAPSFRLLIGREPALR